MKVRFAVTPPVISVHISFLPCGDLIPAPQKNCVFFLTSGADSAVSGGLECVCVSVARGIVRTLGV